MFFEYRPEEPLRALLEQAAVCHGEIDREEKKIVLQISSPCYIPEEALRQISDALCELYGLRKAELKPNFPPETLHQLDGQELSRLMIRHYSPAAAILAGCQWELSEEHCSVHLAANGKNEIEPYLFLVKQYLQDRFSVCPEISAVCGAEKKAEELFAQTEQIRRQAMRELPAVNFVPKEKPQMPADNEAIFGRAFKGKAEPISGITQERQGDRVTLEGKVFAVEHREVNKGAATVIGFDITDYTGSVHISDFFKGKEAEPITSAIKEPGMWVRVRGRIDYDKYIREMVIRPEAIIHADAPLREDRAEQKRVELHLHTTMSMMDALTKTEEAVATAARWGHQAIAITDHGVVSSFPAALKASKNKVAGTEKNIKILYGCEGYFVNSPEEKRSMHILVFAKNQLGIRNLYHLVSDAHLRYFYRQPRMPRAALTELREGLIIGSACEAGELFQAVIGGKSWEELKEIAAFYDFLEIQPLSNNRFMLERGLAKDDEELKDFNRTIVRLGEELGKPVCATGDVHFLDPEEEIYRRILLASKGFEDCDRQNPLYFRTTDEMLEEFSYLGAEKAFEVVVTNPNRIADMCDVVRPVPHNLFAPAIENSVEDLKALVYGKMHRLYGENPPEIVTKRVETELHDIISCHYDVIYMSAQKLVQNSLEHGYLVGSRGSVGSSLVAFLSGITEVNSLPAHYRCPQCKYCTFEIPEDINCGADLPDARCPHCGAELEKDGFNIPFETFLGFGGDKVPDIDLNFSGEYQAKAHAYCIEMFGASHVFRAGTIGTVADKTAFGYVKKYLDERNMTVNRSEENRLTAGCVDVRRTTGQHPGGLVVIPQEYEIWDFCPVQHPADDPHTDIITTHFEYHSMEENLLKLDMLGHDDPTMLRMLQDMTDVEVTTIPLDDKDTMSIFTSSKKLGYENDPILGEVGSVGIPEFGTGFTRGMLVDTKPTQFDTLIRLSGFSHGTDVWLGNARDLIVSGTASVSQAIGCRDDIMIYLIKCGLPEKRAFQIMEAVRKGRGLPKGAEEEMRQAGVPDWYIDSCKKIKYLFPKAHAAAYVMMAFRIAWFKVHRPLAYYSAYFYRRSQKDGFDAVMMTQGIDTVKAHIKEISENPDATQKDKDLLTTLEVCYEFYLRGFEFAQMDLYQSHATQFLMKDGKLLPPFVSVAGLGETAAWDIFEGRKGKTFISIEEFSAACPKVSKTHIENLKKAGVFGQLPESSQVTLF